MTAIQVVDRLYRAEWSRWWQAYCRATAAGFTVVEYIEQLHWDAPGYASYEVFE